MADDQKDSTWSVKTTSLNKTEVDELIKQSGLTAKDFFEQLVLLYKKSQLEGSDAEKSQDIQQVNVYLDKIRSHFVATIEKVDVLQKGYNDWMESESRTHKQIVDDIQRQKMTAEEERDTAKDEVAKVNEKLLELNSRISELESINKTQRVTIQVLEEKNDKVNTRVQECVLIEENNQTLLNEIQTAEKRIESLNRELENYKRNQEININNLKKELQQTLLLKENLEKESVRIIEQLKQIHQLEKNVAVIETEKRMLELLQKTKDELNSKIETLVNKNRELIEIIHLMKLKETANVKNNEEVVESKE